MKDESCIFCKIANGEIPSNTIYEDDTFRAILDLGPATRGHALLLPKEHYRDLSELPEETAAAAMRTAKSLLTRMVEALHADGMNLVQNNGAAAGQTVMHYHLHLIPRYEHDNAHILWEPTKPSPEELEEIRRTISP